MKLKKEQQEAVGNVAAMVHASLALENLDENIFDDLPEGFDETKLQLKKTIEAFYKDMNAVSDNYVEKDF